MKIITFVVGLFATVNILSCSSKSGDSKVHSVYYWSTTLDIDSVKDKFISKHGISKIYIRYFDVVQDVAGDPVPNATLRFKTGVPNGVEVIPTVYIVNECMAADTSGLAEKLLKRILQMNETNDIADVKEIQIDCDWTARTRNKYFGFLQTLRGMADKKGLRLSATIRLHQLSDKVPPVDRGVLMMYNTGDFTRIDCEKPIIDMRDAAPYMRNLNSYSLPLAAAYPIYSWRILFRGNRYIGIIHRDDELPILPGDSIVVRQPAISDILEAVNAVGKRNENANDEIILFDLSNQNITRYTLKDYETIFNGHTD